MCVASTGGELRQATVMRPLVLGEWPQEQPFSTAIRFNLGVFAHVTSLLIRLSPSLLA